jgi:hypothetical protein
MLEQARNAPELLQTIMRRLLEDAGFDHDAP